MKALMRDRTHKTNDSDEESLWFLLIAVVILFFYILTQLEETDK